MDNSDPLKDGEHWAFKVKRLRDELGEDMLLPEHCNFCHEVTPKHSPTCLNPRKK